LEISITTASFQTTVSISGVGMAYPDLFQVGGCPPCPLRAGASAYRTRKWRTLYVILL